MYAGCIPLVSDIPSNRSILEPGKTGIFLADDPDSSSYLCKVLDEVASDLGQLKASFASRNQAFVKKSASVEATARVVADLVQGLS
jgi:hypothetical protein